jgi:hypothetical protein
VRGVNLTVKITRHQETKNFEPPFQWYSYRKGDVKEYILQNMSEPCCDGMDEAMKNNVVVWGDPDKEDWLNKCSTMNLTERFYTQYDGAYEHNLYPINFCPFCGESIDITYVEDDTNE